jgi:hypothetical protein
MDFVDKVYVTQEDIEKGVPESAGYCPVSVALRKNGYEKVKVNLNVAEVWEPDDEKCYVAVLPEDAIVAIARFDAIETMDPMQFTLKFKDCSL